MQPYFPTQGLIQGWIPPASPESLANEATANKPAAKAMVGP